MKQAVQAYASRFNTLSLRERVLVAFAGVTVAGFLLHLAVLAPQIDGKKAQQQRISQQRSDLAALQGQLAVLSGQARDPDAAPRRRLAEARTQIDAIDTQIKTIGRHLVPAQEVSRLLQDLLGRREGLRLVSLRTLPVADVLEQKAGGSAPVGAPAPATTAAPENGTHAGSAPAASSTDSGIYKHGVQITVQGSYHDLAAYLADLERLPQRLFWSQANLRAEYPLSTLTVTVFTLSLERTWLTV
ncbi:MAG: type II secretion system protein GspM [Rhodocyclaceae bacterium]